MTHRPTDYLVAPALRLQKGEGLAEALRCLREFDPRVFLIFGGDAEDVEWLHETVEEQAGHPVLFCADLERGAGQQFGGLTPLPDAWALGLLGEEASYDAGHRTGAEAAQARVRWILGPVLDLHRTDGDLVSSPVIANRAFGGEVQRVVECAGAWLRGLTDAGGLGCGKHFPGHGACSQNTHEEPGVCFEEPGAHLEPFEQLIGQLPSVMLGHLEFPTIDPEGRPASRSKPIVDILRKQWEYDGVIVTDSLRMGGFGEGPAEELAIESVHAGADLLLDPEDPVTLAATLRDALDRGEIDQEQVFQSVGRIDRLIRMALDTEPASPRPLVLGGGARTLLRPLPGGAGGSKHPRPGLALNLAATPDAIAYLEEWGVPIFRPQDEPPEELPEAILVLFAAREGHGMPNLPGPWLEAIHEQHPKLYVAGSPDGPQVAPASARGWHLPGISPALLGMLLTEGAE